MNKFIKKLAEQVKTSKKEAYDSNATVTRVESDTAYVKILGSDIDDTPCKMTISCKKGDTVKVRVSSGRAYIIGNQSSPPTDDSYAEHQVAKISKLVADNIKAVSATIDKLSANVIHVGQIIGDNFSISKEGILNAKGAEIEGKIQATSGSFNNLQTATGYYVHTATGTNEATGYVKIATISIVGTYPNAPIRMLITQRGKRSLSEITIAFANENSTDPEITYFYYTGEEISAYLAKTSSGVWNLYVLKSESYDSICVMDFNESTYDASRIKITWTDVHQSSAISGWTQATKGGLYAGWGNIGSWKIGNEYLKSENGSIISYSLDTSKKSSYTDEGYYYAYYTLVQNGRIIVKYNWNGSEDSDCETIEVNGGRIVSTGTDGSLTEINNGTLNTDYLNVYETIHNSGIVKSSTSSTANLRIGTSYDITYVNSLSSKKFKHDISTDTDKFHVENLYDVDVVSFRYNDDVISEKDIRYDKDLIGFIAEDIAEKFPQAADYDEDGNVETWSERYIIPGMLKLIQNQKTEIDSLSERISKLEELMK